MKRRSLLRGARLVALASTLMLLVAACSSTTTTFTMSVAVDGTGAGSVSSDPVGIDTTAPDGAQADFADGTTVTLTASAGAGSSFTGWGGACATAVGTTCDVTMDAAKAVTASFDEDVFALSVAVDGTGGGVVTSSPAGIDTSVASGDQSDFADGTLVTLTASPDAGSVLAGWGGACATAVGTTCDVTMDAAKNASATFDLEAGKLDLTVTGLPLGVDADIRITGPDGYDETFTQDVGLTLAPGSYTVTPSAVTDAPAIYRALPTDAVIVNDGQVSVNIAYERPVALFYTDGLADGDPYIETALIDAGYEVTFTTTAATFDTQLAGGTVDIAIVMDQSTVGINVGTVALQDFVNGGGALIGFSWSQEAAFEAIFDATYTGATNTNTTLVTATVDEPALVAGISNPIDLVNPLAGNDLYIYTTGLSTASADAVAACSFENTDSCMVVSDGGSTILLGFSGDSIPLADGPAFWQNVTLFALGY